MGEELATTIFPKLIELYKKGKFPFDKLIKYYSFEEINEAIQDTKIGTTIKPIIKFE